MQTHEAHDERGAQPSAGLEHAGPDLTTDYCCELATVTLSAQVKSPAVELQLAPQQCPCQARVHIELSLQLQGLGSEFLGSGPEMEHARLCQFWHSLRLRLSSYHGAKWRRQRRDHGHDVEASIVHTQWPCRKSARELVRSQMPARRFSILPAGGWMAAPNVPGGSPM
ncbi:hypothetical protein NM208_g11441 [Fusarium decemcellulare]|uniref:Uncharacterized protein n=1 Tax=Fusarium decemcellulare TaxID=57161 RepID=A0ACC1RTL9_9HYPO|nr:hypothetical protein NM208_g11441 [Fusarium decemcellulare]